MLVVRVIQPGRSTITESSCTAKIICATGYFSKVFAAFFRCLEDQLFHFAGNGFMNIVPQVLDPMSFPSLLYAYITNPIIYPIPRL